jgi:hypothetical protein
MTSCYCRRCGGVSPGAMLAVGHQVRVCSCGSYNNPTYPWPAPPPPDGRDAIIEQLQRRIRQLEDEVARYARWERDRWESARNAFGIDKGFKFDTEGGYWGPG